MLNFSPMWVKNYLSVQNNMTPEQRKDPRYMGVFSDVYYDESGTILHEILINLDRLIFPFDIEDARELDETEQEAMDSIAETVAIYMAFIIPDLAPYWDDEELHENIRKYHFENNGYYIETVEFFAGVDFQYYDEDIMEPLRDFFSTPGLFIFACDLDSYAYKEGNAGLYVENLESLISFAEFVTDYVEKRKGNSNDQHTIGEPGAA